MLLKENILLALAGLKANKMRSFLTMLGIIIGIASVIAIMTVGDAVNNSVTSSMGDIGANNIELYLGYRDDLDFSQDLPAMENKDCISTEMIEEMLKKYSDEIKAVSLQVSVGDGKATEGKDYANVSIIGANTGFLLDKKLNIVAGRNLAKKDQENGKKVAVISDRYVENMFNGDAQSALGQLIDIKVDNRYYTYTVVGVYEYSESQDGFSKTGGKDITTNCYIPYKTGVKQSHAEETLTDFMIIAKEGADSQSLSNKIANYFNQRYYKDSEYFQVSTYSMDAMLSELTSMISTIKLAVAAIAGISLLVGGIGVMNIMIVSITERTREIGTRKALGATNGSIRLQFITEAVVICMIGGFIGVLIGIALGMVAVHLMGYSGTASIGSITFCVAFSMAFGIFFGYYPASRAAKLNPIEALRYE